jgi:deoxyadenosine/deoxycytidine kinase
MNIENKRTYRACRKKLVGDSNYNVKVFFAFGQDSPQLDLHQSHMGGTSNLHMQAYFLPSRFKNVSVLSDAHITYKSFFKSQNFKHCTFIARNHINFADKSIHNQTVNSFIRGFK